MAFRDRATCRYAVLCASIYPYITAISNEACAELGLFLLFFFFFFTASATQFQLCELKSERESRAAIDRARARNYRRRIRKKTRKEHAAYIYPGRIGGGLCHVCLITFQSTRQSATPLSASHQPENYSFIPEQAQYIAAEPRRCFPPPRDTIAAGFQFPLSRTVSRISFT